jgi:hypothetical protein
MQQLTPNLWGAQEVVQSPSRVMREIKQGRIIYSVKQDQLIMQQTVHQSMGHECRCTNSTPNRA